MSDVLQFGERPAGPTPDRPAAFAVIERGGQVAVVRCDRIRRGRVLDLPGGGIDPGESAVQAAVRECGEEAGLVVELDAQPFVRADHYFLHNDEVVRNTRGQFFQGRVTAFDASLQIEEDHELVWMSPQEAVGRLDREAHRYALQTWLRLRGGA